MSTPLPPSRPLHWPFAVIAVLLALMVLVPMWQGEHRADLLDQTDEQVSPARGALLSMERAFATAEADADAFLLTGDTIFLQRLRTSLSRARTASLELEAATETLGPDVTSAVRQLRTRIEGWIDATSAELGRSSTDPDELLKGLDAAQPQLQEALASAAKVDGALERVEHTTRTRIRTSEITEDVIIGSLALAAVTISVLIAWLLRRLQRSEDRLRQTAAEREDLLKSERQIRQELESAVQTRDAVLRIVSHDLRNPLHTIGIAADLLGMQMPEEVHAEQLRVIRRTVDRAGRMLRDLLDASRIQSGHSLAVNPTRVDIHDLLGEAVEAYRYQATAKEVLLEWRVEPGTPDLMVDRDRVIQALTNLVGNALKFTPRGGQVRVLARSAAPGRVDFAVSDSGPGIPPDLVPRIFEPFSQAADTATLGTGIGLSIVKAVVEAHGGVVTVESEPGDGAVFRFSLPAG